MRGLLQYSIFLAIILVIFQISCAKKLEESKEMFAPEGESSDQTESPGVMDNERMLMEEVEEEITSSVETGGLSSDIEGTEIPKVSRKIIITGSVKLEVKDVSEKMYEVMQLCEKYTGRVDSQVIYAGEWGKRVEGYTTCRIPIEDFYKFLEDVEEIGEVTEKNISSEDVTLQHIDLLARLENAKHLEVRYLDISNKYTGSIEDILRVESEIARIREEIEILEGRLRNLQEMESLSTLTVQLIEPESAFQPLLDFGPTVKVTFSWAQRILIGFIGFLIILIPFVIIFLFFFFLVKLIIKLIKRRKEK